MTEHDVPWLDEREMRVWRRWLRVQTDLQAALGRELSRDSGLSLQDFETLVWLSEAPDERLRISALAERMHWERSRLSHHLRRMSARGLVGKEGCKEDGRGSFVQLTDAGRKALDEAAPEHVRAVRRLFLDGVEGRELEVLEGFLERVLERVAETETETETETEVAVG